MKVKIKGSIKIVSATSFKLNEKLWCNVGNAALSVPKRGCNMEQEEKLKKPEEITEEEEPEYSFEVGV